MAIQSDHEFAPTQIARAVFPTAFRGYDQDAVRRFLSRLAAALEHQQEYAGLGELEARTSAHERVEELEAELESLRDEIKDLELELVQRSVKGDSSRSGTDAGDTDSAFDEHRAIELLGKETARVLESARSAAADIMKRAETHAASLKTQAKTELADAELHARTLVSERQAETHELVERLTADAEAEAERIGAGADEHRIAVLEESKKILSEAETLAEAGQTEAEKRAKQIVADAETLRQQVISELVVDRREAQGEMDRMNSARDRLAMSLAVARSELDEIADALADVSIMHLSTGSAAAELADAGPLALVSDAGRSSGPGSDTGPAVPSDAATDRGADPAPDSKTAESDTARDSDSDTDSGSDSDTDTGADSDSDSGDDADPKKVAGSDATSPPGDDTRTAEVDGLIEDLESALLAPDIDLRADDDGPGHDGRDESVAEPGPRSGRSGATTKRAATKTKAPREVAAEKADTARGDRTRGSAKGAAPKQKGTKQKGTKPPAAKSVPERDTKPAAESESTGRKGKPVAEVATITEPDVDADLGVEMDLRSGRGPAIDLDVAASDDTEELDTGFDLVTDLDLDTAMEIDPELTGLFDDMRNQLPADGSALSLVEGFTTIDLNDDADARTTGLDSDTDRNQDEAAPDRGDPSDGRTQSGRAQSGRAQSGRAQSGRAQPAGAGAATAKRSNAPATPDDVITTVASRTALSQPDRTRGDLLIDEVYTGRLPKEFAARDLALTRSGPNFRRQLRRALNDDQSEVLDRLRAGRGEIKVDELPAFADQIDRYLAPLRRGLAEIAQAGARAGGRTDLSQAALDNLVRQLGRYIVDKVRIPTIQVLQETNDHDRERILEPIRALYRDFRNVGLSDLTEDALYEAFAIGLYDAIEPKALIRWMVDPRSDPDPVCDINRERLEIIKGDVFPSGHSRPLSLPGCRCLVIATR